MRVVTFKQAAKLVAMPMDGTGSFREVDGRRNRTQPLPAIVSVICLPYRNPAFWVCCAQAVGLTDTVLAAACPQAIAKQAGFGDTLSSASLSATLFAPDDASMQAVFQLIAQASSLSNSGVGVEYITGAVKEVRRARGPGRLV